MPNYLEDIGLGIILLGLLLIAIPKDWDFIELINFYRDLFKKIQMQNSDQ